MGNCQSPQNIVETSWEEEGVRIGLITDMQYADIDDGSDFDGTEQRHYRMSLQVAKAAVKSWNSTGVTKVIQLGNIIDGSNAKAGHTWPALKTALTVLSRCNAEERIDLIGNHELYNIKRADLALCGLHCTDPDGLFYRSVHLGDHWEAIILEPYELAVIGRPSDDESFAKASRLLATHNPQVMKRGECGDWSRGLPPEKQRYVPVNGGISKEQLAWLDQALRAAEAERRKVLVFTHVPLYEPATKPKTLVWNCEEVLAVLHDHKDTVVAVLAGHDHNGGYAVDHHGLHHVTMHSALTTPRGTDCFASLECFPNGSARFHSHGHTAGCRGEGDAYTELLLAKGAQHHISGAALRAASKSNLAPASKAIAREVSKTSLASSRTSQASTRSTTCTSERSIGTGLPSERSGSSEAAHSMGSNLSGFPRDSSTVASGGRR